MAGASKPLNLPWHQEMPYWIGVFSVDTLPSALESALKSLGMNPGTATGGVAMLMRAESNWGDAWEKVSKAVSDNGGADKIEALVISGSSEPDAAAIEAARRPMSKADSIAKSLWLGRALLSDNVLSYLQPVVSRNDKTFGYESFVRVRRSDHSITGGGAVVEAARALGIEYAIDRQLHIQAVKTFVSSELNGSLFINCMPGFIQRPDVYLEGLAEAVRAHGVIPKNIILDVMDSESPHDIGHVKRIAEYCRNKGFAIALDDLQSFDMARKQVTELRPDYVKLDMRLVAKTEQPAAREVIRQIVEHCHANGAVVVAEGVETKEILDLLKMLQVDLFQGYYFSAPVPVEQIDPSRKYA